MNSCIISSLKIEQCVGRGRLQLLLVYKHLNKQSYKIIGNLVIKNDENEYFCNYFL